MLFSVRSLLIAAILAWIAVDAARRGRNWVGWAVLVSTVGMLVALVWLVVRRRSPPTQTLGWRRAWALRLVAVPLVALNAIVFTFITTFVVHVARVEGHAMEPTIEDQDHLLVNKLVYRRSDPRRGDIVMLQYPLKPEKTFVKRVVGEEGDLIKITDGTVYVNEQVRDDSFIPPEYRSHTDWGPEVVPEGYYFVMGDHRNNSSDSRHWGFVPKKYILGRVAYRWWPVGRARAF